MLLPRVMLAVALGAGTAACSPQSPPPNRPSAPQISGTMSVDGLSQPVRVVRDRWGIPHIYAKNQDDLFFAQGFVQAQDRLFQMDLWRRSVQGRLSEVLGANFIERDAMTRRMQYRGDMRTEWASYPPDTEAIAHAFVRGVNAFVDFARTQVPEEFALAGWTPERWTADDLVNRTDAFLASFNATAEVFRAQLATAVGVGRADLLLPPRSSAPTVVPRGTDIGAISYVVADALRRVGTTPVFSGFAAPLGARVEPAMGSDPLGDSTMIARRRANVGIGSNAWAVSARRSTTGAPLLAVDPHRLLAHPSLRYLVHLNAPGWNVIGAAAPWLPGVVIGHNDRIAWGMTSLDADVQDLYIEEVNPANPHQIRLTGGWVDTVLVADPIVVKGRAKPFEFEREYTPHGVLIASDRAGHRALVLRWTGFEPGTASELGALALGRAQSDVDFQIALERWKLPAATFLYATADGRIGSLDAAAVPVRRSWNGELPVAGSTGQYEWGRWRLLAAEKARDRGGRGLDAVWSANDSPSRTNRLADVFRNQRMFDVEGFKALQRDTLAWNAAQLVPLLNRASSPDQEIEDARRRLVEWDRQLTVESSTATLYVMWEQQLMRKLAEAAIPSQLRDEFVVRAQSILVPALTRPSAIWFGGHPVKRRDELLLESLDAIVGARTARSHDASPRWGVLHKALFRHPLGITEAARMRFNVGPFEQPGYGETVMSSTGSDADPATGASFRAIFDVGDWDRSVTINAPGQSGLRPSPHFLDLASKWAAGEYIPLPFSERAVLASADVTLTLEPRAR
jgi:penicillin amidase